MAHYRVIGTDGREYGPVSHEQIRLWIGEGRVHAATLLCAEGSMDWRILGVWPEFRPFVAPAAQVVTPSARYWPEERRTNGWAIWGFVCGLLSLVLCSCCCLPFNLLGLLFSLIALVQISNHPQTQSGTALAVLGLIFSVLSLALGFGFSVLWITGAAGEEFLRELKGESSLRLGAVPQFVLNQ